MNLSDFVSRLVVFATILTHGLCNSDVGHANTAQKEAQFEQASMAFDGNSLVVSTGVVTRSWRLTKSGMVTVGLQRESSEYCNLSKPNIRQSDWTIGTTGEASLVSLTAKQDDDDGFTSQHLLVEAIFEYPDDRLIVKYVIWAYPGAPGIRTQLQLRSLSGHDRSAKRFSPQIVESLDLEGASSSRKAFGLMQGIKSNMNVNILRERDLSNSTKEVNWANGVVLQQQNRGIILVKESNKHTHLKKKSDVATGGFALTESGVSVTGAGMFPADVREEAFRNCWATWIIPYNGNELDGNLSLKQFDRLRYPIDPDRDIYIMANTWGTEDLRPPCLHAAREQNVLEELESVADLGIDVLQIDDGWQTPEWLPAASARQVQRGKEALAEFGDYPVYPEGWSRVREKAERLGVSLGLWAAWTAPQEALQLNYDQGNFKYFKLDFAHLDTKDRFDDLTQKARELIKHTGHTAAVNWDVTEIATRMGFFCGREYGNIYLENRKINTVRNPVLYVPYKVLNDAWNLSKYVNLNKFQVTVQNIDHVVSDTPTDAAEHNHEYVVGIALMSSPIFFQETRYYEPPARQCIRELLKVYKKHRLAMYQGYVFPIGNEPDNFSWTGFQNHNPKSGSGYLTIFRERLNRSPTGEFQLRFVKASSLRITNLSTNESETIPVGLEGVVEFTIPEAPGFLFLQYEAI